MFDKMLTFELRLNFSKAIIFLNCENFAQICIILSFIMRGISNEPDGSA